MAANHQNPITDFATLSIKNDFGGCAKLTAIHVPANAKSWAGMKEWQGIPLVFDAESQK